MSDSLVAARATSSATVDMAPAEGGGRIDSVDILRGIAVLGILLVNIGSFSGFQASFADMAWVDRAATVATRFVAQGKFYPLFAFLFGWGMALQMVRATSRGVSFAPFFIRRMLALLLIGLLHAVLVWHGDILVIYALLGLPLLLFRNASDRTLLVVFVICLAIPVLISLPGPGADFRALYAEATRGLQDAFVRGKQGNVFLAGSYPEAVRQRIAFLRFNYAASLYWITPIFGMMLLGVLVGRRGLLQAGEAQRDLLKRIAGAALLIGLPLNVLWVWVSVSGALAGPWQDVAERGARTVGGAALALFMVAGLTLLVQRPAWQSQLSGLAAVGRTALSNYLLQSLVFSLLFYGYGLAAYGDLGPFLALLLALLFFRLQVWLSNWWLARYRFGPVEWVWRSITYGAWQPLKA